MLTEFEIETMMEIPAILEATQKLKKDFIRTDAPYLEIGDHDFFGLIMLAPTVGVALANGSVSLFEELALNKKARKASKGGYFLKKDPTVYAMKFLLDNYTKWEEKFFDVLKIAMNSSFDIDKLKTKEAAVVEGDYDEYKRTVLNTPYILIRFISSFFLQDDEHIIQRRSMNKTDYERLLDIGQKLDLHRIPVFQQFCLTFKVKG
ncbi:MAG: hypothetical protein RIG68_09555 [Imperialibacter sp.]|uniref:hypothetical protein n=1 Tax=Imperialibacter sp. TaxID=2038411 RepID=UPI0032F07A52